MVFIIRFLTVETTPVISHLMPLGLAARVLAVRVPLFALQIEPDPRALAFRDFKTQRPEQRLDVSEANLRRGGLAKTRERVFR
jgi:hypothetical protein